MELYYVECGEELVDDVPSRDECLKLITETNMPANIKAHSLVVESLAVSIARMCIGKGYDLDMDLVVAGALLHDVAKAKCIVEKCNHALVGAQIVRSWGYPRVAMIIEQHISLCLADIVACPTEALIVNYADKRVLHDRVVSLNERFEDLIARYGTTGERTRVLRYKWHLYRKLEEQLSKITGDDIERLGLD